MNWYLAKIIFRIYCSNEHHKAQFEEQLRIIHASTAEDAMEKARDIALNETSHSNETGLTVKWQFVSVSELLRLHNFIDGAELFSLIHEEEHGDLYEEKMHKKEAQTRYQLKNRLFEIF